MRRRTNAALAAAVAAALSCPAATPAGAAPDSDGTGWSAGRADTTGPGDGRTDEVTLVTGDRVLVGPERDGRRTVQVHAADRPGGRSVSFRTWQSGTDTYVVPDDVARLVPRVLDPALFDVTALARAGLDDAGGQDVPLLVQTSGTAAPPVLSDGPLRPGRTLHSIHATAATLHKGQADRFGADLAAAQRALLADGGQGPLAGVGRIWLDAPFHALTLDANLDQVGAPAAWRQGLSGSGVRVAVLDTGVDESHPDLAGQVVASANFTGSPSATDHVGHGTHVASIIAGTGAASTGDRRGVAFGAGVLNGKVLDDTGSGDASSIIAGMQWAVSQGARVVNLSIGTFFATDGTDPISQAVDELTRQTGALFVVAAGNNGPDARTVGSPGAADLALTVGAVDADDRTAPFSSRGPRLGDHALKPDITAPGVAITAARAAGTTLDTPVDDRYVRASGTSMATPHVAGAAALLAQQHPDWDAAALKAALVTTAEPADGVGVYEQGGGRLDLPHALAAPLRSDTAAVDFATVPVSGADTRRTVTVTNGGTRTLRLSVGLSVHDAAGAPAPDGTVAVDRSELTLPTGGSAALTVTLHPATAGAGAGEYTGALTLTPDGAPGLRLPVAAYLAPAEVTVHLRAVDRDGEPYAFGAVHLVNAEDVLRSPTPFVSAPGLVPLDADGEATVTAPVGTYAAFAFVDTIDEANFRLLSTTLTGTAETRIDTDTSLVLDARTVHTAPRPSVEGVTDAHVEEFAVGYHRSDRVGRSLFFELNTGEEFADEGRVFVQPTEPVTVGAMEARRYWRLTGTDASGPAEVMLPVVGDRFPDETDHHVTAADLAGYARVAATYRGLPADNLEYRVGQAYFTPLRTSAIMRVTLTGLPLRRTEYFLPDPRLTWGRCVLVFRFHGPPVDQHCDATTTTRHPAGERSRTEWLDGPLDPFLTASRSGDTLRLSMSPLTDADSRTQQVFGFGVRMQSARVLRDGLLLKDGPPPAAIAVPSDRPSWVRVERGLDVDSALVPLPSSTRAVWTFVTLPSPRPSVPPVLVADVRADLDDHNRATAGEPLPVTVDPHHLPGATPVPVTAVTLWASADDGGTWTTLPLRRGADGTWHAEVPAVLLQPGGALGLRVSARDALGDSVEQTVLRSLTVR